MIGRVPHGPAGCDRPDVIDLDRTDNPPLGRAVTMLGGSPASGASATQGESGEKGVRVAAPSAGIAPTVGAPAPGLHKALTLTTAPGGHEVRAMGRGAMAKARRHRGRIRLAVYHPPRHASRVFPAEFLVQGPPPGAAAPRPDGFPNDFARVPGPWFPRPVRFPLDFRALIDYTYIKDRGMTPAPRPREAAHDQYRDRSNQ